MREERGEVPWDRLVGTWRFGVTGVIVMWMGGRDRG